jgi:hypothetical protein
VFRILSDRMVTISGVTITEGHVTIGGGGGIDNLGNLTVINSTISGNYAGAFGGGITNIGYSANLTVINSTISGNNTNGSGGGIINAGTTRIPATLTVTNSTISGNAAGNYGGGIASFEESAATQMVTGSTISGNTAGLSGGGIHNFGLAGSLMLTNSTVSENYAGESGGGIFNFYATATLMVANSTIAGNSATMGGGINNEGDLTVKNSIVANNLSGGNCTNEGIFTALGDNLADDGSCPNFDVFTSTQSNLGDLADNGGLTFTHALPPGSVAINAVSDCTLVDGVTPVATDQRGVQRPQGTACDLGAFELAAEEDGDILEFFDQAVESGTLEGNGPGQSAAGRLNAFRNMLVTALDLIRREEIEMACGQLRQAYLRTDGGPQPPDFVKGPAAKELAERIEEIRLKLDCK